MSSSSMACASAAERYLGPLGAAEDHRKLMVGRGCGWCARGKCGCRWGTSGESFDCVLAPRATTRGARSVIDVPDRSEPTRREPRRLFGCSWVAGKCERGCHVGSPWGTTAGIRTSQSPSYFCRRCSRSPTTRLAQHDSRSPVPRGSLGARRARVRAIRPIVRRTCASPRAHASFVPRRLGPADPSRAHSRRRSRATLSSSSRATGRTGGARPRRPRARSPARCDRPWLPARLLHATDWTRATGVLVRWPVGRRGAQRVPRYRGRRGSGHQVQGKPLRLSVRASCVLGKVARPPSLCW